METARSLAVLPGGSIETLRLNLAAEPGGVPIEIAATGWVRGPDVNGIRTPGAVPIPEPYVRTLKICIAQIAVRHAGIEQDRVVEARIHRGHTVHGRVLQVSLVQIGIIEYSAVQERTRQDDRWHYRVLQAAATEIGALEVRPNGTLPLVNLQGRIMDAAATCTRQHSRAIGLIPDDSDLILLPAPPSALLAIAFARGFIQDVTQCGKTQHGPDYAAPPD